MLLLYMSRTPVLLIQCVADVIFSLKFNGAFPFKVQAEAKRRVETEAELEQ